MEDKKKGCWRANLKKKPYYIPLSGTRKAYSATFWTLRGWKTDDMLKLALRKKSKGFCSKDPEQVCFHPDHLQVVGDPLEFGEDLSKTANLIHQTDKALASMTQHMAQNFLENLKPMAIENAPGCRTLEGGKRDDDGYIRVKTHFKGGTELYANRVVLLAAGRLSELERCFRTEDESLPVYNSSHLCHENTCTEPRHIIVETSEANVSRNTCHHSYNLDVTTPYWKAVPIQDLSSPS